MPLTQDEAEFALKAVVSHEQQRFQNIMKPYFQELSSVLAHRPLRPFMMPDGRMVRYVGPTAEDLGGPYVAPRWLEELCQEDRGLALELGRYRDRNR